MTEFTGAMRDPEGSETASPQTDALTDWHCVGRADEVPLGARKIVDVAGRSIGVFNVDGEFTAIRNVCPHARAPVCLGRVTGTTLPSMPGEFRWARDGQILSCPWHGWEFDMLTGESIAGVQGRLGLYKTKVEGERIFVRLPRNRGPTASATP